MGSTVFRAIGLKVGVIIAIREKRNWICCYLNEAQNGRGCFFKIIRKFSMKNAGALVGGGVNCRVITYHFVPWLLCW